MQLGRLQEIGRHEGVYKQEALIQKLRELQFIGAEPGGPR
jgi:hypothetical protein